MKRYYKPLLQLIIAIIIFLLIAFLTIKISKKDDPKSTYAGQYFNTYIQIDFYTSCDDDIKFNCLELCEKYDKLLNAYSKSSEIYKINNSGGKPTKVSKETFEIINLSIKYAKETNGYFNPCLFEICNLWKNATKLPNDNAISDALLSTNFEDIVLDKELLTITLPDDKMKLDLGGIVKGYVADKLVEHLQENNVSNVVIDLGGSITTIGKLNKNHDFNIGIRNPDPQSEPILFSINSSNNSIVSSGQYERSNTINEKKYGHIINPFTGYPCKINDLVQTTVIGKSCSMCDAYSTALFVMGKDEALKMLDKNNIDGILLDAKNKIHYSKDIKNKYTISNKDY